MGPSRPVHQLGARERQILDALFRLEEGSVADVRAELPEPPSYSSVRTMIRLLESKGFLKHREQGAKYMYRPTQSARAASKSAVVHVLKTFFHGSPSAALAAILDVSSDKLTEHDLARMKQLIERAKQDGV
jgi:predicted transcriptional regulator